jgi:hypothetical protein
MAQAEVVERPKKQPLFWVNTFGMIDLFQVSEIDLPE